MTNIKSEVGNYLNELNVNYEEITLEQEVHSVSDVANLVKCSENEVLKTLLFTGSDLYFLVVLNGTSKIQEEKLQLLLSQKVKLSDKKSVIETTGFEVGTVSPFLIKPTANNIKIFADKKILNNSHFFVGSGHKNILIKLQKQDFLTAFKGTFVDL